jgi:tetratricopeptide (TPR) repeat protein
MKPFKSYLIAAAAISLFAALSLLATTSVNAVNQGVPQNADASETIAPQAARNTVVSDSVLPQAQLPVLRIGDKEDPDVYLQSLDIQVEVTGNIASTRYTMVFKNRTNRILEGELTFPLPDGRTVTHYALDINGKMREAVPVEKARATQVFEEIEQREVDPGILERVEGNNFRTRIYPFPRNGTRTISIGYEEELTLENGLLYYRLPMAYPNPLEKFAVKAAVWNSGQEPLTPESEDMIRFDMAGEQYVASFTRENYRPSRALVFALPAPTDIPQVIMQSAQRSFYFLASVAPKMETRKKQWSDNLAIIWDVSLSASQRNLQRELEMLDIIFSEKRNANVHLYFLNNRFKKAGEYKVTNGNWSRLKSVLQATVFDGGTDFSQINLNGITGNEILFFSDGISTLSDADFLKNTNTNRPVRPIHCVVSSAKADYSAMRLIAGKTRGKFVNANALSYDKLKSELLNETLQFLGTEHGNAVREVYPSIAMPVQGNFSVAGISNRNDAEITLLFGFGDRVERRIKVKLDAGKAARQGNIHRVWAQKKITELDLNFETNREELTELGQQFGIVTRNTSLIVLELISDYVRFDIEPPAAEPELQAEYQRRLKGREGQRRDIERDMLNTAVAAAENLKKWWDTDFTPQEPKYPMPDNQPTPRGSMTRSAAPDNQSAAGSEVSADIFGSGGFATDVDEIISGVGGLRSGGDGGTGRRGVAGVGFGSGFGSGFGGGSGGIDDMLGGLTGGSGGSVNLQQRRGELRAPPAPAFLGSGSSALTNNRRESMDHQRNLTERTPPEYLKNLTKKIADDYQTYLRLRNDHANSPAFYFDMADWFYKLGDREIALRVLTSIAELELENASLYRLLGYRFKEYGEHTLQKFVTEKVIQWRPMEPQSYRDHALALADNGETQAALDSLNSLLTRAYSESIGRRSSGIEEVVITEMNRLITKYPNLNTSGIDRRLIMNVPVDVRVVINWNMNNVDVDLYVIDPHNETCYYRNRQTRAGGRISADNRSGYGPEQFILKNAIKGKYQIHVRYHSAREFAAAGPSTVMAEIYTKYGDKSEQRQVVTLQLPRAERAEVAEFEI